MGRLKIYLKINILLIFIFFISGCGVKTWTYDIINNYQIKKFKDASVKIGINENNKFTILIDEYVFEYQKSNSFIGTKVLVKDTLEVNYYIIDTKDNSLFGPYVDMETYEEVVKKITDNEKFGEFIKISDYEK